MSTYFYATFPTPFGAFSVATDDTGAVIATAFGGISALRRRLTICHLIDDKYKSSERNPCHPINDKTRIRVAQRQVGEFFNGKRTCFELPLAPAGTPFQRRVWKALLAIPFGETRSYGQLAAQLGSSARAVGRALATNPICLIIPCHRVIGADGSLTGFAFGESLKQKLLDLEDTSRARSGPCPPLGAKA
ncbi:MAG: methylated-DNA--[protein]-cysteine S-methyltransferase [Opitutaceae bacterium]|nr:methylated-DNA--[protein]-cysteine S-methyltransferase [Opitutaceae bacterium]